jgi:hypothetical protein
MAAEDSRKREEWQTLHRRHRELDAAVEVTKELDRITMSLDIRELEARKLLEELDALDG